MSMRPEATRSADRGRRQVERDGLAGDEVVVAQRVRCTSDTGGQAIRRQRAGGADAYSDRVDIDAFVAAHVAAVVPARGAEPAPPAERAGGRRARRRLPGGRHPPVGRPLVGAGRRPGRATSPACWPGRAPARPAPARPRGGTWSGSWRRRSRRRSTGLRRWWLTTLAANVAVAAVMMTWLLQHPGAESSLMSPAEADRLVNVDFEHYYSEYAASHFAAQVWTNNAWVAALCIALGVLGLPVIYLLFSNILNVAVIGALMIQHDRGVAVLRADPAARHARAHRGLRRRRGRAAAVLVVGRAGRPHPRRSRWRTRAAARPPSRWAWCWCCFVSGVIEAFVTPSGLPTWARIGIGVARRGGVLRLRVRARPSGVPGRPHRGHGRDAAPCEDRPPSAGRPAVADPARTRASPGFRPRRECRLGLGSHASPVALVPGGAPSPGR